MSPGAQLLVAKHVSSHDIMALQCLVPASLLQSLWQLSHAQTLVLKLTVLAPCPAPHPERRVPGEALQRDTSAALR